MYKINQNKQNLIPEPKKGIKKLEMNMFMHYIKSIHFQVSQNGH